MRYGTAFFLLATVLAAQSQPTFYAAYQDGLDAERQGHWTAAITAFRRAIELRPASAAQVIIYGNNLLKDYAPHTHLARCLLESGELDAAHSALERAAHFGEPKAEREALAQSINRRRAQAAPIPKEATPPPPVEPTPKVHVQPEPPAKGHVLTPVVEPPPALPEPVKPAAVSSIQPPATSPELKPPPAKPPAPGPSPSPSQVTPTPTSPESPQRPSPSHRLEWSIGILLALGVAFFLFRRWKPVPEETSFSDPKRLGPYEIERLLGRGGFASTFLARHTATGNPVALKLLHPYRHDDPEFVRRFRQEAKLGTMLDHPNLVRMLDPGSETGPPWLAMEYITGRRLDQKLREDGPPALPEFARIALQIAGAMAHAHEHGIVHRDLKPGNVIFEGEQAKVMDFGISRVVDSTTLTTTYAFLGTPKYAAPEAQLKVQVGPAADRYALGIMLFEMLAGHAPFDGETPFEILDKHHRMPLPNLAALRPDLPANLVDLIERLCRKAPDQRPSDEDVIETLGQLLLEQSPRK